MAAMISAVDDGVGEIRAELERQNLLENTILYFQSDNGPSRESRNWLDGNEDLYYGGSTGVFSGHKFSLFEGGIRVPAILFWKGTVDSRVVDAPHIATDIFPTVLELCGGNPDDYELDGASLRQMLFGNDDAQHDCIFWEMEDQTAVRKGKYKLVLNGRTDEGEAPRADVFLADLENDPGEKYNLAQELPDLCAELKQAALAWRDGIEKTWKEQFEKNYTSLT